MNLLLPEQAEALRTLQRVGGELGIDVVVVGAIALRVWIADVHRLTEDVDVVVALDLDDLSSLTTRLAARGWHPDPRWEPRWHSPEGARIDLLPIGERALQEQQIQWPRAETVMRVVGHRLVFEDSNVQELAPGLRMLVAPLHVLALLKIVAYLDAPELREKDLGDLLAILARYEEDGERRFSDDILDAGVQFDEAGAFLLGQDLWSRCDAPEEEDAVRQFLQRVTDPGFHLPIRLVRGRRGDDADVRSQVAQLFAALARGFGATE